MFPINAQVVESLTRIRKQFEAAWGPEGATPSPSSNAGRAAAGVGGAINPPDTDEAYSLFMNGIIDRLMGELGMDEDEAIDFVFDCAEENPDLPPIPSDEAPEKEVALWLGAAASIEFGGYVLGKARAEA